MTTGTSNRRQASLIRALQYFEAVARYQSVKLAAEELCVSQSAVSHQLRELTDSLGEQLLTRSGRGIALTSAGQRLAEKLASTFAGLQSSIEDVVGGKQQTLRLAVCSCFGPGWLIGKLQGFFASHPEIDLQLRLYAQDPVLTDQVADAFVTALPVSPGFNAVHVLDEMLVPVLHPRLGGSSRPHRLITTELESGYLGREWLTFCVQSGVKLSDLQQGSYLQCTHYLLALEMAKAGLGMALVPDFLARQEIEAGRLALYDKTLVPSGRAYNLCYKHARAGERGIRSIVHWLKGQAVEGKVVEFAKKATA
jgi:LysR family glycine cleavage system transcriptional activator